MRLKARRYRPGWVMAVSVLAAVIVGAACSDSEPTPPEAAAEPSQPSAGAAPAPPSPTPTPAPTPDASPTPRPTPAPFVPRRVSTATPTPPPEPGLATLAQTWSYDRAPCRFEGMWAVIGDPPVPPAECGYLTVPEDRTKRSGQTIRLHVAVFKSGAESPPRDPIVYLEGGPGGHALATAALGFEETFGPYLKSRDLVIFDQRGTGFSEPALECPESLQAEQDTQAVRLNVEEEVRTAVEALIACRDRLVGQGVDLAAYSSKESAADLNALRDTLGYDEWNLLGTSYGTKLALTTMRDYPEGIRSVILDSTHPLEVDFYASIPKNANTAFTTLFDSCASHPSCADAFPHLQDSFYGLVDQLNLDPVTITSANPLAGEAFEMLLTGDDLVGFLFQALYSTALIPVLPEIVSDAAEGRFDAMSNIIGLFEADDELLSLGMHLSVRCGEEAVFTSREQVSAHLEPYPELAGFVNRDATFEICPEWSATDADPTENLPVHSEIPTLVLAGQFDPVTPAEWGRMAASNLANSYYFEFPGMGHGVSVVTGCPISIALDFLDDPTTEPDSTCLTGLTGPDFVAPGAPISLVPITGEESLIDGVVPDGWSELAPGFYGRTDFGLVALLQQAVPGIDADQLLIGLSGQLGLSQIPDAAQTREANDLIWKLYELEVDRETIDLAIGEGVDSTYLVMLTAIAGKRDAYYDAVYVPAIDALRPRAE